MVDRRAVLAGLVAAAAAGRAHGAGRGMGRNLEGVWTTASYTDLQRAKGLPLVLTPTEAAALEAPRRALNGQLPAPDDIGQAENEYIDRGAGLARVKGQIRSSWIIDPPDGRIPWSDWALKQRLDVFPPVQGLSDPEARTGTERCTASVNGGAPMVGAPDANLFQIIQPPGCVAIFSEKYHDVRIVRFDDGPPAPRSWMGDSVGRWEGDTLVVDTSGFREGLTSRGFLMFGTGDTRVTERFTRLSAAELFYEFTIADPMLFTRPWRAEMSFPAANARIFEYACHEGNYGLPGILAGARREEREAVAIKP